MARNFTFSTFGGRKIHPPLSNFRLPHYATHSILFEKLWRSFFFTFSPLLLRPNEKIDSLVHLSCINITLVESWMEFTATARRMRASPRFRSTLLASFFLLAVFFLTFWNRHGAERGSLTKVGNHTHRFHAIPVRSTRLQGGQVGRARVFLPFRGGTPRKYSRRSSLSRRMRMIDGTGNIFPLFPIMMEQFAEERSMKATLLLLPGTKWLVPGTGERSLKANACGVSERSLRGFHQTICKLAIFSLPFSFSSFFHAIKKWTDRILGFKCRKKSYFIARISSINIF